MVRDKIIILPESAIYENQIFIIRYLSVIQVTIINGNGIKIQLNSTERVNIKNPNVCRVRYLEKYITDRVSSISDVKILKHRKFEKSDVTLVREKRLMVGLSRSKYVFDNNLSHF